MSRPLFFLDRFDGNKWVTLFVAPHQIGPSDLRGPEVFPPAESPENIGAFGGLPGCKARVRVDDTVVEEFDWALIPINPLDPNPDYKWGWKSLFRNYGCIAEKFGPLSGSLSFLG